jgi:hypothetical protein
MDDLDDDTENDAAANHFKIKTASSNRNTAYAIEEIKFLTDKQ